MLFLLGAMVPVRWEGKQTFWSGLTLQRCGVPHVSDSCCSLLFPSPASWSWNDQVPVSSWKRHRRLHPPSPRAPLFSWAPRRAQSAGIPAISNTLKYWGGNMWGIWMIDPPLPLHPLPLSLLSVTCWGGGDDSGGLVVWTRSLWYQWH